MAYHLLHDYDNALQVLEDFRKTLTVSCQKLILYCDIFKLKIFFIIRNPTMTMNRVSFYSTCIK